jgi:antitoxin YefM
VKQAGGRGLKGSRVSVRSRADSRPVQHPCTIEWMATETTYTSLRQNLASLLDQVVDRQEAVIVRRKGARDVALIPAAELAGLIETAHLLRSPRNARRLLTALGRAKRGKGRPATVAQLRREILGDAGR